MEVTDLSYKNKINLNSASQILSFNNFEIISVYM